MKILIDAAPDGYAIIFEMDDGTTNIYPETIHSLQEALRNVLILADEVEKVTGVKPESLVKATAVKRNKHRDIDAYKLWNNPNYRVVK